MMLGIRVPLLPPCPLRRAPSRPLPVPLPVRRRSTDPHCHKDAAPPNREASLLPRRTSEPARVCPRGRERRGFWERGPEKTPSGCCRLVGWSVSVRQTDGARSVCIFALPILCCVPLFANPLPCSPLKSLTLLSPLFFRTRPSCAIDWAIASHNKGGRRCWPPQGQMAPAAKPSVSTPLEALTGGYAGAAAWVMTGITGGIQLNT